MQTPEFWFNPPAAPGIWPRLLAPLGALYGMATARRLRRRAQGFRPDCPVISVGNINAGGTGKTPTVIALLEQAQSMGLRTVVISRGYGGREEGPLFVNPTGHSADQVGDEPLLLAGFAPVVIGRDRARAAQHAMSEKPDLLILDDAFQNPDIQRDFDLIVVDAQRGFGNGRCIPAGPLREPIGAGFARADAILSIGTGAAQERFAQTAQIPDGLPHHTAMIMPLATGMPWQGQRVCAFAGIGHPEKFFDTLRGLGAEVIKTMPLADHQTLPRPLLQRLLRDAQQNRAQLVTTEKDAARLPADLRGQVLTLPVRLIFQNPATPASIIGQAQQGFASLKA